MIFFEFLRVGWTVIRSHKFRSALTLLSIAIGTFSVVVMSSLVASAQATISQSLEEVGGARMILLIPKHPERAEKKQISYSRGLTLDDAEALRGRVAHVQHIAAFTTLGRREVSDASPGQNESPLRKQSDLVAGNEDFLGIFRMNLVAGRGIDAEDMAGRRRVAVLGHGLANTLFSSPEAALGRVVRAGTDSFRVVGVVGKLKRFGMNFGFDWNDFLVTAGTVPGRDIRQLIVMMTEGARYNEMAARVASAIVLDRHKQVDDFFLLDAAEIIEQFFSVFRVIELIAGVVASIALLAGGIGVMNILLVSVSERLREIGIRKAIGASDVAVAAQFLFESALLASLGGAVGALMGSGGAIIAGWLIRKDDPNWVTQVSQPAQLAAILSSLAIGIFFGLVPARKAGRLQVVECLRAAG